MAENTAQPTEKKSPTDVLNGLTESLQGFLGRTNPGRMFAAIGLLSATIAGLVVATMWMMGSNYVPLYTNQEAFDTANIIETLETQGIDYEVQLGDGSIWVPRDKLASARMKMAANGIKPDMPAGMEKLDQYSGISTSQFMEGNRYNFAVEGELAKSIMAVNGVSRARVHLAIPERTLFIGREEQKPTASVILDLSRSLDSAQVEAIINLVSGSVTGLKPESVSVVDQKGNLLSSNLLSKSPGRASVEQMDYVEQLEKRIANRAGDMLDPILGDTNYRIRVAADIDFSKVEETHEILNGDPVLISENRMVDTSADAVAGGIPGSLSNQAPMSEEELEELGITEPAANKREETSRRFQTGRTVTHKVLGESRIGQLSVSVLINDKAAPEGGWSDEQIAEFGNMVKLAAGINEDRGDQFKLSTAPFADLEPITAPELSFMQQLPMYMDLAKLPFIGLIAILLILFGIRPLIKYITTGPKAADTKAIAATAEGQPADPEHGNPNAAGYASKPSYELPSSESELTVQVDHLKMLVDEETPRVAEIIKTWVRDND